jgi:hypothetical protein
MSFSVSDSCGSFGTSGQWMQFTAASTCRSSTITVTASLALGAVTVSGTRSLSVEWLTTLEVKR